MLPFYSPAAARPILVVTPVLLRRPRMFTSTTRRSLEAALFIGRDHRGAARPLLEATVAPVAGVDLPVGSRERARSFRPVVPPLPLVAVAAGKSLGARAVAP